MIFIVMLREFVTINNDKYMVDAKKALTHEKRQNPIRDTPHETFNALCVTRTTRRTKFLQL